MAAALAMLAAWPGQSRAQHTTGGWETQPPRGFLRGGPGTGQPLSIAPGVLLVHGNYCGPGDNGPGLPPVDALDAACMRHDACTPDEGLPSCACNARLARDSRRVADDPRTAFDVRILARATESVAPMIACHR